MDLRLDSITHDFGAQRALDGVSLHVHSGDCYGFLGHNGAGKTTAMRIALGLLRPDAGRVIVDGFDAREFPVEARARMGGLIETPGFHARLSGQRNLELLARLQGLSAKAAKAEASRLLHDVGLAHAAAKPAGAYSQGMRQRLGIAQALLGRPPIVLLDEPTNGLDPEGIEEIRRLLHRLTRDEGITVLLSSHQLHELSGLCNRIAILREGQLLIEEETAALVGGNRHILRVGDTAIAESVLTEEGLEFTSDEDDAMLVTIDEESTDTLLAHLVEAGARPRSFAPRANSLEDVYLRLTRASTGAPNASPHGASAESASTDAAATDTVANALGHPARARSPGFGIPRMLRCDLRRWFASPAVPLTLLLPALAGAAAILLRRAEASGFAAEVQEGGLATTTDVTAFEGVGEALSAGLPVLALVAAGLASQSLAGELARGTLRNIALRPLSRVQIALGKALAVLVATALGYAALVVSALGVAGLAFDYADVTEILFNGERFPLVEAAELWPPLREALWRPAPAVAAYAGLGVLASAITRRPAAALATALGLIAMPDLCRAVLRGFRLEWAVPSAHVPTPLGDTSFIAHYLDLSRGVSNTSFAAGSAAWAVPLVWTIVSLALSSVVLSRRSIR